MKELPEDINPPKWADRFFKWYCYAPLHESIYGDMQERYDEYLELYGLRKANRKYWLDVLRFMNRHTLKRSKNSKVNTYNPLSMLSNYFKVGFRNLLKNRSFTVINVLGLSISMAVCLVIILMINDQLSYDDFQTNKDRIYRITHDRTNAKINLPMATIPLVLADHLDKDFAGIEHMVRFSRNPGGEVLQNGKAINISGLQTEPSFFDMFSFELEYGNRSTCLTEPNSIVLRKDIAEKFFGDTNPVNETMTIGGQSFKVTGVLKTFPGKSHLAFESLVSMADRTFSNWESSSEGWLYFTLQKNVELESLRPLLASLADEHYNDLSRHLLEFDIQKMKDITPGPLYGNQIGTSMPNFFVIGLGVLGTLIIICAAFNYTNLSAARALTRTKEVGVRKVLGARKHQLSIQFIIESILVSLLSLLVAFGLLQFLIPAFENLQMSALLDWDLNLTLNVYLQFIAFAVVVGLITGFFPALYLSSFKPIQAMKNMIASNRLSRVNLRKALIVCQFVISLVLIVSSTLVYRQIKFMVENDYGYTKENIINVQMQGQDYQVLNAELRKLPFVQNISGTNIIPNTGRTSDVNTKNDPSNEDPLNFHFYSVDEAYIDNLGLDLIAGRNFIPADGDGDESHIIINESGAKALGFETALDAIGQPAYLNDTTQVIIAGVVKNYNYMILYVDIEPLMFRYQTNQFQYAQVKITGFDISDELTQMEATWDEFDPNHEFIYKTFQGEIDEFNAFFYDILYIIGLVAVLSVTIAALGLLGIATYSIQVRLKEVSIRKVLGASSKGLILLLSKGFMYLFAIAMVIGFTLAYLGNSVWLDGFAYRVSFGVDIFLITAVVMIGIGILTIGLQALRATTTNPANILRDD